MVITLQFWLAALTFLVIFCYLYSDEISDIFDWLAWKCAAVVIETRLALWKLLLTPRIRYETWARRRRMHKAINKYSGRLHRLVNRYDKETNHKQNNE